MTDYIVKDGISNYRDSYRKQYLFNNANPGCNIHVTIHVYIHNKVYNIMNKSQCKKLSVAGSVYHGITRTAGFPFLKLA